MKTRRFFFIVCVFVLNLALSFLSIGKSWATIYTVTTTQDTQGGCMSNDCSLRDAINAVNLGTGGDTIAFNIPGDGVHTITPASPLPPITQPSTRIDGYTQLWRSANTLPVGNNAQLGIEIKGPGGTDGLVIMSDGNTIQGLVINNFNDFGGIIILSASGNVIPG